MAHIGINKMLFKFRDIELVDSIHYRGQLGLRQKTVDLGRLSHLILRQLRRKIPPNPYSNVTSPDSCPGCMAWITTLSAEPTSTTPLVENPNGFRV